MLEAIKTELATILVIVKKKSKSPGAVEVKENSLVTRKVQLESER